MTVGPLPVELSACSELITLRLSSNKGLCGSIPTEYSALSGIRFASVLHGNGDFQVSGAAATADSLKASLFPSATAVN